jgi:HD-GYP domain-containing protein (c-di-GMP phosphodiesterase class II)
METHLHTPAIGADPVLTSLGEAAAAYSEAHAEWEHARDTLAAERDEAEAERRRLAGELEREREAARRERRRSADLREALCEVHRAMFGGNVYEMILRACLSLTGGTRGLYVTCPGPGQPLRVRAAADVDGYPRAAPSEFLDALCRRVLRDHDSLVWTDSAGRPADLPAPAAASEDFRSCVATPVVLLRNLNGVIMVADKPAGNFSEDDVEALLSVGHQSAVAVENRHLQRELQSAYISTVSMLADAVEAKDPYTHGHCEAASRYARLVAREMRLSAYDQAVVCYAALLHDVGKIGVSDGVLNKPGPLLPEEVELMRAHVRVGHDLLANVPALRGIADVVLHHHERYDGTGYPDGLRGAEIPVPARIVAVVDAYCAMMERRSYKEPFSGEAARAELSRCAGSQFDPGVVETFLAVLDTPEAEDPDDDYTADCGLLPVLTHAAAA